MHCRIQLYTVPYLPLVVLCSRQGRLLLLSSARMSGVSQLYVGVPLSAGPACCLPSRYLSVSAVQYEVPS